jgi:CrcB protein
MTRLVFIAVFGLLGVFCRYGFNVLAARLVEPLVPVGTFVINIAGAFGIGVVYVLGAERGLLSPDLRFGLMVGLLGGFTTFSSYCLETLRLFEGGATPLGFAYYVGSPVLGLAATYAGLFVTRALVASAG